MYSLMRHVGGCDGLLREAPPLTLSMIVAALFYGFYSLTLECVAFLAPWFVVSYLTSLLSTAWSRLLSGSGLSGPRIGRIP